MKSENPKSKLEEKNSNSSLQNVLTNLLKYSEEVRQAKAKEIQWTKPLISHQSNPIVFPNSITTIQGQSGSHKSRMAQNIVSALIAKEPNPLNTMGFARDYDSDLIVSYIDTERNHKEQFPSAIQEILINAGYSITNDPDNLKYLPILMADRKNRLPLLAMYIEKLREEHPAKHIVIVLDVIPDIIGNFNDETQTYELIDLLNICINKYAVSFLCIIHENPESDKARGHLGTELGNKSTTVMQIKAIRNKRKEETGVYRVKYLKTRATKRPVPYHVSFDDETRNLVLIEKPQEVDPSEDYVAKRLFAEMSNYLVIEHSKEDTLNYLSEKVGIGISGLEKRINKMVTQSEIFSTPLGDAKLIRIFKGRKSFFQIQLINPTDPLTKCSMVFSES